MNANNCNNFTSQKTGGMTATEWFSNKRLSVSRPHDYLWMVGGDGSISITMMAECGQRKQKGTKHF
jgi:hypothetical protein